MRVDVKPPRRFAGIQSVLKSARLPRELQEFRHRFQEAVSESRPPFNAEERAILDRIPPMLASWHDKDRKPGADVYREWLALHDASAGVLPVELPEALLKLFPKSTALKAALLEEVLRSGEKTRTAMLLKARVLGLADLKRLAKSHPLLFYKTPALDLLLERGAAVPLNTWKALGVDANRPPELLSPAQSVVLSYQNDPSPGASSALLNILHEFPWLLPDVVEGLLRRPEAGTRLAWHLAGAWADHQKGARLDALASILCELLDRAIIRLDGPTALDESGAVRIIAVLRLLLDNPNDAQRLSGVNLEGLRASLRLAKTRSTDLASSALVVAEGEGRATVAETMIVLTGLELHDTSNKFLRSLPTVGTDDEEMAERVLTLARFGGKKDVLLDLLGVLDQGTLDPAARAVIEMALDNAGVRPIGQVNDSVHFDPLIHEATVTGLLRGDPAFIIEPGRALGGGGGNSLVLRKAAVTAGVPLGLAKA